MIRDTVVACLLGRHDSIYLYTYTSTRISIYEYVQAMAYFHLNELYEYIQYNNAPVKRLEASPFG